MSEPLRAKSLTSIQLKMLDVGAPVIVPCPSPTGETVYVRLQTRNLTPLAEPGSGPVGADPGGDEPGGDEPIGAWETHGVYIAIMPGGLDYGC